MKTKGNIQRALVLVLTFFTIQAKAQSNTALIKYYHIADSAKYFENNNDNARAIYYYKKLLGFNQFEIRNFNYENLFQLYLKQGNTDSAKYYLTQSILNAGPMGHDRFTYLTHDTLKVNIDSLNNLFHFDYAIYTKINKLFIEDQTIRNTADILAKNKAKYDSTLRAGIFTLCDSLNFVALKQALIDIGHLPTTREIGSRLQGNITIGLMVHHFKKDPVFWRNLYKTAIDKGTVERESFPLVEDYCHFTDAQDLKAPNVSFIFCEYINYKMPNQIPEPTYPKEVDKLRAEFYLPPLYWKAKIENLALPQNYQMAK